MIGPGRGSPARPAAVARGVDVLVLDDASPTARFSGPVGAHPLYEASPGLFARTQMAAALEFYETAWLRELDLQRMASS